MKIRITNYLRQVKLSETKRKKYFLKSAITPENPIPKKYEDPTRYIFKKGKLYDSVEKDFVIKNSKSFDKPRYISIAGNEVMRMHERVRIKIITTLKNDFKSHILESLRGMSARGESLGNGPYSVTMTLRTQFGFGNWDVDNLWIYHKCFLDTLTDLNVISNDNVMIVRQAGATNMIPIAEGETPSMEFEILSIPDTPHTKVLKIQESETVKAGEIEFSFENDIVLIGVGKKKVIMGAAHDALRKVMYWCLNNFSDVMISATLADKYSMFLLDYKQFNIKIIKTGQ